MCLRGFLLRYFCLLVTLALRNFSWTFSSVSASLFVACFRLFCERACVLRLVFCGVFHPFVLPLPSVVLYTWLESFIYPPAIPLANWVAEAIQGIGPVDGPITYVFQGWVIPSYACILYIYLILFVDVWGMCFCVYVKSIKDYSMPLSPIIYGFLQYAFLALFMTASRIKGRLLP